MNYNDLGNTQLVDHGITTEQSDFRAHVCVNAGRVYVFSTAVANVAIESGAYRVVQVKTERGDLSLVTAEGFVVPAMDLNPVVINCPANIGKARFEFSASTSDKGNRAVWVVEQLLKYGKVPIPFDSKFVKDSQIQRQGFDLVVHANFRIEVKCDYKGGGPDNTGPTTGNLFLQVRECNPFRQY